MTRIRRCNGATARWPTRGGVGVGCCGAVSGTLADVVAIADGFAAWVIAVLADAGRKS